MRVFKHVLYSIIVLHICLVVCWCRLKNGTSNTDVAKKPAHSNSIVALMFSNKVLVARNGANRSEMCSWLKRFKAQNRQCTNRRGFPEVLMSAKALAVAHCEEQFRWDRWNCTKRKKMFKKVFRETAFMHSLSTAAIMFSVARACANGTLQNCGCSLEERSEEEPDWKWGDCGDNVEVAQRITRKFLQLHKKGDGPNQVLNYDSEMGIKAIMKNEMKVCACHGVSDSCVMKTCWRRIQPFRTIATKLKKDYHNAIKLNTRNQIRKQITKQDKNTEKLFYLAQSPNFCKFTAGRRCQNTDNCATLCCARDYEESVETVVRHCDCRWEECCYNVTCKVCKDEETVYTCL